MNQDTHPQDGPPAMEVIPEYVKCGELAKRIGLSPSTVRSYGARGILPRAEIVPGSFLYPLKECLSVLEASRTDQPLAQD